MEETLEYGLEIREPAYAGQEYSADDVEALRLEYKSRHETALTEIRGMEGQYGSLSQELSADLNQERWAEQMRLLTGKPTLGQRMRGTLARMGLAERPRPMAEVLEQQLEAVQDRIYKVARLRESIDGHTQALEADIRRLNQEVVAAARNERAAAAHVLGVNTALTDAENAVLLWDTQERSSVEYREAMARVDELRSRIRVHGSKARAFGHAEARLETVLRMNRSYLEMLNHSAENMEQLTRAAQQVVEEIAGNVQALTSLTAANDVANDLMTATRTLRQGINSVASLASRTSLTLAKDIDQFVSDLSIYDQTTVDEVERNLNAEKRIRQAQVEEALAHAYETLAEPA